VYVLIFKGLISGVAKLPCVSRQKLFLRPHQQKLQSLKWK